MWTPTAATRKTAAVEAVAPGNEERPLPVRPPPLGAVRPALLKGKHSPRTLLELISCLSSLITFTLLSIPSSLVFELGSCLARWRYTPSGGYTILSFFPPRPTPASCPQLSRRQCHFEGRVRSVIYGSL